MRPEARREQLLLEEVGEELVIYDLQRHRAHQLNRTAALVWQSCDGHKTVAELTKLLQTELDPAIDDTIVWQALQRLGKARLLKEAPPRGGRMTRRQALHKLGQTAGLALLMPAVTSILTPAPLAAATHSCQSHPCLEACKDQCTSNHDCPPGNPICRLMSCHNPNCVECTQFRCTKQATPH